MRKFINIITEAEDAEYNLKMDSTDKILIDNFLFGPVHINDIKVGDVVLIDGVPKTVSKWMLTKSSMHDGQNLLGDSYKSGRVPVMKGVYQDPRFE